MIGEKLRTLRERCGMTQEQLAESIGVSAGAIAQYEANRWRPGHGLITRMAELLKVTVPELVGECMAVQDEDGTTVYIQNRGSGRFCTVGRTK